MFAGPRFDTIISSIMADGELRRSSRCADAPNRNAVHVKYGSEFEGIMYKNSIAKPLPSRISSLRSPARTSKGADTRSYAKKIVR